MPVALRGAAAVPGGTQITTDFTVAIPAEVVAGDVLFIAFTSRDSVGAGSISVTDNDTGGNTWARAGGSADYKANLYWKRATSGTASKTITVAGCVGSSSGVLKCFSGVVSSTPYANVVVETNASADETHAGFTPTYFDSMICVSVHNYNNDNAVTSLAGATIGALTMTEKLSAGGSDCSTAFGHALNTLKTATGDFTWAQTNGTTYSISWEVLKAPAVLVCASAGWTIAAPHELTFVIPKTYYVAAAAAGGNDSNDGSIGSPWATARKASRTVQKGDTVYFRATNGQVTEFVETAGAAWDWTTDITGGFGTSWDAGQRIRVAAYPGDEGLIVLKRDTASGTGVCGMFATATGAPRYAEFRNLIFDGWKNSTSAKGFIPIYTSNNGRTDGAPNNLRFYGCEVRNSAQSSGYIMECGAVTAAISVNIIFSKDAATGRRGKAYTNGTSTAQHGFYIQGKDCEISYTDIYSNVGLGLQVHKESAGADNCDNILIRNCRAYSNGQTGIYYGIGQNGKIWNCLAYDNVTHGIRYDGGAGTGQMYNCTSVRNGATYGNFTLGASAQVTDIDIKNCVARKLGAGFNLAEYNGSTFTVNNCVNIHATDTDATDPLFTNPASDDFTLQANSPCVGAGADLSGSFTNDLVDAARSVPFDIGAFEYVSGPAALPVMLNNYMRVRTTMSAGGVG